jgi:hypothetical protein
MKRNNLTTAVVAGIAGVAGIASVSNAVNLNSDGVGQVLVYPYYTVNNGLNTLISVVNTTDEVKAVKVRFLEGKNSRECLDFNLYMSPYDVWTAGLVPTVASGAFSGAAFAGQDTVKLVTADTSCTAPAINGYEFLPFGYAPLGTTGGNYDGGGLDLSRCTEGHFEVIEMGVVSNTGTNQNAASSATHTLSGVPSNCGNLIENWQPGVGQWIDVPEDGVSAPTGGLFGSASIINVDNGTNVSYNADAIQGYSDVAQHSDPGNLTPNLGTGTSETSNIFDNGLVRTNIWNVDAIQAVSALYMHNRVYGEYELTGTANTEMVVTFPTKFAYVDPNIGYRFTGFPKPYEPFETAFTSAGGGTACEDYSISIWDREEQVPTVSPDDVIPSPTPPGVVAATPIFCWETNVLELHNNDDFNSADSSAILGSNLTTHFETLADPAGNYFDSGWIRLTFNQFTNDNVEDQTYTGLPVTGFSIQRFVNTEDASGARNYAGLFKHRYARNIISS